MKISKLIIVSMISFCSCKQTEIPDPDIVTFVQVEAKENIFLTRYLNRDTTFIDIYIPVKFRVMNNTSKDSLFSCTFENIECGKRYHQWINLSKGKFDFTNDIMQIGVYQAPKSTKEYLLYKMIHIKPDDSLRGDVKLQEELHQIKSGRVKGKDTIFYSRKQFKALHSKLLDFYKKENCSKFIFSPVLYNGLKDSIYNLEKVEISIDL